MFGKKKGPVAPVVKKEKKSTPAYLKEDYRYKSIGEAIIGLDSLEPTGVLYEIKCPEKSEKETDDKVKNIRQLNNELRQICQSTNTNRSGLDILINYYQKSFGWTEEDSIRYTIELFKNGTIDQIKVFGKIGR